MKTNALLKISGTQVSPKNKKSSKKQDNSTIQNINQTVNELWEMYQNQLQRNVELMKVIQQQQQYIQSFVGNHPQFMPQSGDTPLILQLTEEAKQLPMAAFKDLTIDQVNKYTSYFKVKFDGEVRRLDAIHTIIRLLYTLYHLGGSAFPDVLIAKAGIVPSTANRHLTFLRNKALIDGWRAGNHDHRYHLTKNGRLFLQGKLNNDNMYPYQKEAIPDQPLIP